MARKQKAKKTTAWSYIRIGELLCHSFKTEGVNVSKVHKPLEELRRELKAVDILELQDNLTYQLNALGSWWSKGGDPPMDAARAKDLQTFIGSLRESIKKAAESMGTIPFNESNVSAKFLALSDRLPNGLNPTEAKLFGETTRCLACGAYRSAVVMGWNLAFDYIRQWVFDKQLAAFNKALATNYVKKTGQAQYDPINAYSDFLLSGSPGERIVLDTCNFANIIVGNVYEDLKKYLRERNAYAHPSGKEPTANKVNGYLEDLTDIMLGNPFR